MKVRSILLALSLSFSLSAFASAAPVAEEKTNQVVTLTSLIVEKTSQVRAAELYLANAKIQYTLYQQRNSGKKNDSAKADYIDGVIFFILEISNAQKSLAARKKEANILWLLQNDK